MDRTIAFQRASSEALVQSAYDEAAEPAAYEASLRDVQPMGARAYATAFATLAPYKYCQLVTFRRDGSPAETPVWFAVEGDKLYVQTEDPSYKIARIRRDTRARVAPCTLFGRHLGPAIDGRARILAPAEEAHAEEVLRSRYGLGRRLFALLAVPVLARRKRLVYVEVVAEVARGDSSVVEDV